MIYDLLLQVEGRMCDRCMENTKSKDTGGYGEKICEPCDDCYNLVQDAADEHRRNLAALDALLQQIAENPEPVGEDFEFNLKKLQVSVKVTLVNAKIKSQDNEGGTLRDRLGNLRVKLQDVIELVINADSQIRMAKEQGREASADVQQAKQVIDRARDLLKVWRGHDSVKGHQGQSHSLAFDRVPRDSLEPKGGRRCDELKRGPRSLARKVKRCLRLPEKPGSWQNSECTSYWHGA